MVKGKSSPLPPLHRAVIPVTLRGMAVKHWRRSSVGEEKRLTEDRRNLAERYMIDAEEAHARAERAAQEEAGRAAEEEARRAAEAARRAGEEAKQAAEQQAKLAAKEAKGTARAGAAATRVPQPVEPRGADPPVAGLSAAAPWPAEPPPAAPPLAERAPAASEIAEPHDPPESEPEATTPLPIYGWLDSRPKSDEALDSEFLSVLRPTARAG